MVSRVSKWFHKSPGIATFLRSMRIRKTPVIDMQGYQAGIDNLHVDVALSQKFQTVADELVRRMVIEDLKRLGYSITEKPLHKEDFDRFREVYRGLLQGTLDQARAHASVSDLLRLLQLTLLKVLLAAPGLVINQLRRQLKEEADQPARSSDGRSLELHERLVFIAKHESGITYRTLRRLFKVVQQLETAELRKVRKSVIGTSWVISKQLLFNPLLHLPNLSSEEYLMNHYPVICMDRDKEGCFVQTNRLICEVFAEFLPDWAAPVMVDSAASPGDDGTGRFQVRDRQWRGGFSEFLDGHRLLEHTLREEEFKELRYSWLDTPSNINLFFHKPEATHWFKSLRSRDDHADSVQGAEWPAFAQYVVGELLKRLQKTGLLKRAIAAYRTPRLYRQLQELLPPRDIYLYLTGDCSRRSLLKRFGGQSTETTDETFRALDAVANHIRRMPAAKQEAYANRFLIDFLTFRRDLKLAHFTYQKMSYIRLLEDKESLSLSRDNGTLYEFRMGSEADREETKIRAHVVLKADIRGSTEITRQLMQNRLNPATHFSLNFFGPINKLLDRFNTQKVFVEGDALILTVLEYDGVAGSQALTVAYACALAGRIISVMELQNRQNLNRGLPKLELGLGISFSGEAPAYLYDDRRKIMISPAINQADRLSSCAAELRKSTGWRQSRQHAVEVMKSGKLIEGEHKLLRYNVNGIDLDPPAFAKLRREITMHKVHLKHSPDLVETYFAGRFIDRLGSSHWLVIRMAPIKTLQDDGAVVDESGAGDCYYEVVTNAELIGQVKSKLGSHRHSHNG